MGRASYFETGEPRDCRGCEACVQVCPVSAITMAAEGEGFRYPVINGEACVACGRCRQVCNGAVEEALFHDPAARRAFGGAIADAEVLADSTSGGAFTAIASAFLREGEGSVFGAVAHGVSGARHACVTTEEGLSAFHGSKYAQSEVGSAYSDAGARLRSGGRVLFSGTPCQIAGLRSYLGELASSDGLLTVEVVCEGVPSPLFIKKQMEDVSNRHLGGEPVTSMRYRDKWGALHVTRGPFSSASRADSWDFEPVSFSSGARRWAVDRWVNPFWNIWLRHLMSRPSCYGCPYARGERVADVTLGDLWGVHLYCPDLYNDDRGASLVVCSTEKGLAAVQAAAPLMRPFRELDVADAVRYQGPMRAPIAENPDRVAFMADLRAMGYRELVRKWARRPSLKLLVSKYIWGTNRQVCARKNRSAARGGVQGGQE